MDDLPQNLCPYCILPVLMSASTAVFKGKDREPVEFTPFTESAIDKLLEAAAWGPVWVNNERAGIWPVTTIKGTPLCAFHVHKGYNDLSGWT